MAKFKVGDKIIWTNFHNYKYEIIIDDGTNYHLKVIDHFSKHIIGSTVKEAISRIDSSCTIIPTNINTGTKFNIGDEIQSSVQPLFRCKVLSADFSNMQYVLEVTSTTIRWMGMTNRFSSPFVKTESEFQLYKQPFSQGIHSIGAAMQSLGDMYREIDKKGTKVIIAKSLCDCGGHKCGYKDYTKQHYSWCKVYKGA